MPVERDKRLRDSAIAEMNGPNGISVAPDVVVIGHGYHQVTGADVITFGGYEEAKTKHLITMVLPLELAREARDLLSEQIARVDQVNAAAESNANGDTNDD